MEALRMQNVSRNKHEWPLISLNKQFTHLKDSNSKIACLPNPHWQRDLFQFRNSSVIVDLSVPRDLISVLVSEPRSSALCFEPILHEHAIIACEHYVVNPLTNYILQIGDDLMTFWRRFNAICKVA